MLPFRQSASKLQDAVVKDTDENNNLPKNNPLDDVDESFLESPDSGIDVAGVFERDDNFVSVTQSDPNF